MDSKDALLMLIESTIGMPYIWGGDDPGAGFDCSGLCLEYLWSQGIGPTHDMTADGLFKLYGAIPERKNSIWSDYPDFGKLAFFGKGKATHVGLCLNDKLMVEAGNGGRKIKTMKDAIENNAFVRIRPIERRKDLIAKIMPDWAWTN